MKKLTKPKRPETIIRLCCETCHWWVPGDPSMQNFGNIGCCGWMLPRKQFRAVGCIAHGEHIPFWADALLRRTVGWEGESCSVYQQTSKEELENRMKKLFTRKGV